MLKTLRGWSIALVFALVATLLIAMPNAQLNQAEAANAANWDAGNIISDENFYNGRAMTSEAEVQNFLRTKNPGCSSGATCILNYREPTPTMAASAYCNRIEGRANETAASIIHRVGQACNISQMALIVLLEKEQSLITMAAPSATRFARATGYACPDTAPCDAGFGGFFTQVYYGARAYQYYKTHPTQYRHIAGRWNTVLYNPSSSCGSSQVYIQNNATAGLYNYTPYQPNRAALNNLYGVGDSCSAYGNRNFWRLYTDWFGDPRAPKQKPMAAGSVVQSTGTGDYFIYSKQQGMIRVPEMKHLVSMGKQHRIESMTSTQILSYGLSTTRVTGWGIRCGSTDYFASNQQLQRFESTATRNHYGIQFASLPSDVCNGLKMSANVVTQVATDLRGNLWVVQNGEKRPATIATLQAAGLATKFRVTLPNDFVNRMKSGAPYRATNAVAGAVFRSTYSGDHFLYSDIEGMIRVSDKALLLSMGMHRSISDIPTERIHQIGLSSTRIDSWGVQCASTFYFASNQNLQAFLSAADAAHYLASYTKLPADVCAALPKSRNTMSQVARDLNGDIWVIENQTKRPASEPAIKANSLAGKFRALLPNSYLASLPQGDPLTVNSVDVGQVVQSTYSGDYFIYSNEVGMIRVPDRDKLVSLRLHHGILPMTTQDIHASGLADVRIDDWGMQCGGVRYFASTGVLQPFESQAVEAHYRLKFANLPGDLCALLQISPDRVSQVARDLQGNVWLIESGFRTRTTESALGAQGLAGKFRITLPTAFVKGLPVRGAVSMSSAASPAAGTIMMTSESGEMFVFSAEAGAIPVSNEPLLDAMELSVGTEERPLAAIEELGIAEQDLDNWLLVCESQLVFVTDGLLYPLSSDGLLDNYGADPVELPEDVCSLIDIAEEEATQVVVDEEENLWVLLDGERFAVDEAELEQAGWSDEYRLTVPDAFLEEIPYGGEFAAATLP